MLRYREILSQSDRKEIEGELARLYKKHNAIKKTMQERLKNILINGTSKTAANIILNTYSDMEHKLLWFEFNLKKGKINKEEWMAQAECIIGKHQRALSWYLSEVAGVASTKIKSILDAIDKLIGDEIKDITPAVKVMRRILQVLEDNKVIAIATKRSKTEEQQLLKVGPSGYSNRKTEPKERSLSVPPSMRKRASSLNGNRTTRKPHSR